MFEIILLIVLLIFGGTFAYAGLRGAPWLPTKAQDIERMFAAVEIKRGQVFYDLGCGDGRLLLLAAEKGATCVGYEVSLLPYISAQLRRIFSKHRNRIKIVFGDLWFADFSRADIVYVFLQPQHMEKLKRKLQNEMKRGCVAVSYCWPLADMAYGKEFRIAGQLPFYLYKF
jgi:SAM-dependent methyltransferase